jgi:hypothetical protein
MITTPQATASRADHDVNPNFANFRAASLRRTAPAGDYPSLARGPPSVQQPDDRFRVAPELGVPIRPGLHSTLPAQFRPAGPRAGCPLPAGQGPAAPGRRAPGRAYHGRTCGFRRHQRRGNGWQHDLGRGPGQAARLAVRSPGYGAVPARPPGQHGGLPSVSGRAVTMGAPGSGSSGTSGSAPSRSRRPRTGGTPTASAASTPTATSSGRVLGLRPRGRGARGVQAQALGERAVKCLLQQLARG